MMKRKLLLVMATVFVFICTSVCSFAVPTSTKNTENVSSSEKVIKSTKYPKYKYRTIPRYKTVKIKNKWVSYQPKDGTRIKDATRKNPGYLSYSNGGGKSYTKKANFKFKGKFVSLSFGYAWCKFKGEGTSFGVPITDGKHYYKLKASKTFRVKALVYQRCKRKPDGSYGPWKDRRIWYSSKNLIDLDVWAEKIK